MMKQISYEYANRFRDRLADLYPDREDQLLTRLYQLLGRYGVAPKAKTDRLWSERDAVLITYADMVQDEGMSPLQALRRFAGEHLRDAVSAVHLLPFCPWSSDDGFSVKDYRSVQEDYGDWRDIDALGAEFELMFDLVLNHCSRQSTWFGDYVKGIAPARDYFHEMDPKTDLSAVVRPRPTPLLSRVMTKRGERHVWCTFSADQVDLNWANPDVLFEFLDILLLYLAHRARIVRLDAVAFLWKVPGTTCLHLPKTHEVVKLLRDVIELVAPGTLVLTETNVPHEENISYFGAGDEAHVVYQFSLPPLLLHGLLRGTAEHLAAWAAALPASRPGCTFLNFTASHDGIGVRPLQGLVPAEELATLMAEMERRGGKISWRDNGDGTRSPYELNITYFSALSDPDDRERGRQRFLCSQAVALAMRGIPAVYLQNLIAAENWTEGFAATERNRTLNRRKWRASELAERLADSDGDAAIVFAAMQQLLRCRAQQPAFHPDGDQRVLHLPKELFGIVRSSPDSDQRIICLFNFTARPVATGPIEDPAIDSDSHHHDLIGGDMLETFGADGTTLAPFQAVWLTTK